MCCAVSVNARLDVNVALNRPSYQPSTWSYQGVNYHSSLANDGNNNADFWAGSCTHTNLETNPWWAVDLGVRTYVHSIKFTNRGDVYDEGTYAPLHIDLT